MGFSRWFLVCRELSRQRFRQPQLAVSRMDLSLSCLCRVFLCKTGELQRRARSVSDGPTWRGKHTYGGRHGYHVLTASHSACLPTWNVCQATLTRQQSDHLVETSISSQLRSSHPGTCPVSNKAEMLCQLSQSPRRPLSRTSPRTYPYPHLSSSNAPTHSRGIFFFLSSACSTPPTKVA